MDLHSTLVSLTGFVSNILYSYILLWVLLFVGLYFTIRTRFVQIRYFRDMFRQLFEKKHVKGKSSISSFQAMMISTASRVGTGNIAGIASAIAGVTTASLTGGAGSVFWMWIMGIIGAASAFIESTLAQIWKIKDDKGEFRGGPAYYIEQALGSRTIGIVFAICLILCYAFGFNGLQAYNICSAFEYYMPDYKTNGATLIIGVILVTLVALVIVGGSKRISVITSGLVPIMAFTYIFVAVWTTISNINYLPTMFRAIFEAAFDWQAIIGAFSGSVVLFGMKRGLLSNEAGMGSAPNAAATASVSHPVKQGLIQSLSVYIDTMIICTCSAVIVCLYLVKDPVSASHLDGIPLVQQAVQNSVGVVGIHFIAFAICTFGYAAIMGNYFYAESNFKFITKNKTALYVFRVFCLMAVMLGCVNSFDLAWNLADVFMGFMAFTNLCSIFLLRKWAIAVFKDYEVQKKQGKDPVFLASNIEGMPKCQCWTTKNLSNYKLSIKEDVLSAKLK